jgi:hypothetical protein
MKKNKIYIFAALLTAVLIFSTAALCNKCNLLTPASTNTDTGISNQTTSGENEKTKEELIKEEEESIKEADAKAKQEAIESEQQAAESQQTAGSNVNAPTIRLSIYEGPTYSEAGDICLYRVEAIVTGSPTPTITFSRDDSSGAWGSGKVQVNIQRSQSYTLTATAANSAGTASASINLSWGCGNMGASEGGEAPSEETGGESGPTVLSMSISSNREGGYMEVPGGPAHGPVALAGDNNENKLLEGYVSFDITGIPTPNINTASISFEGFKFGDPSFFSYFEIFWLYWGNGSFSTGTLSGPANSIYRLSPSTDGNFTLDVEGVKDCLQKAIDLGYPRFQIIIIPQGASTNLNNDSDGFQWDQVTLNITYLS